MKDTIIVDLQLACAPSSSLPSQQQLTSWASAAISPFRDSAELTIRIVDETESQSLNQQYRGKDYPTNVLSFPFEAPAEIDLDLLGDLVICQAVVVNEAQQQQKTIEAHWAHMVVHGCLHLLGFDHQDDQQAAIMEPLECEILQQLGFNNPYLI